MTEACESGLFFRITPNCVCPSSHYVVHTYIHTGHEPFSLFFKNDYTLLGKDFREPTREKLFIGFDLYKRIVAGRGTSFRAQAR